MNECLNIYELIQKELDGELTKEELELLEGHCKFCFTCQKMRKEFLGIGADLAQLPLLDPGEDFAQNILTEIESAPVPKEMFKLSGFTGLVAGLTLIFTSGMFLFLGSLIFLVLGLIFFSRYENWAFYLTETTHYWISYFYDLFIDISHAFSSILSPTFIGLVLLLSLISFILLITLMTLRRSVRYEN